MGVVEEDFAEERAGADVGEDCGRAWERGGESVGGLLAYGIAEGEEAEVDDGASKLVSGDNAETVTEF